MVNAKNVRPSKKTVELSENHIASNEVISMYELKHLYVEKLCRKYKLSKRDYDVLYKFSHSFDDELRWEAAELLCDHYTPKAEKVLRRMTYDRCYIVRLNAVDSLCIGKTKKTLRRLYMLTKSRDELIRMYAYQSTNDIIINRNIRKEKNRYLRWIQSGVIENDPSDKVKLVMYGEFYKMGLQKYLAQFDEIVKKKIKAKDNREVWLILNILKNIIDTADYDYEAIMKIIESLGEIANPKQLEKIEKLLLY